MERVHLQEHRVSGDATLNRCNETVGLRLDLPDPGVDQIALTVDPGEWQVGFEQPVGQCLRAQQAGNRISLELITDGHLQFSLQQTERLIEAGRFGHGRQRSRRWRLGPGGFGIWPITATCQHHNGDE